MCGIFSIFLKHPDADGSSSILRRAGNRTESLRELAFRQSSKQRHRGPDYTGLVEDKEARLVMVQERLCVLGVKTGSQPFVSRDGTVLLVANGEIYNYLPMAKLVNNALDVDEETYVPRSDCDVIMAFYEHFGVAELMKTIRGMFAFVLYDKRNDRILMARDPIGIIPMYYGTDLAGNVWVASEMKCLVEKCPEIKIFPPGHMFYGSRRNMEPKQYFQPDWLVEIPTMSVDLKELRMRLEDAVLSHLQCDVPLGALLSGGLDSSLIASIATKIMRKRHGQDYRLKTYSVGLVGGPDFEYSRMVADYIGSDHTDVYFTVDEGLNYIRDIIFHTETYDITTVRCSIPMFLLTRLIKSEGIKMVLSGEGADELLGGYLYFHQAPNSSEFHLETVKRVMDLHYADCLRANKSTAAWGLELRVPFLDTDFVNYVMSIRPEDRMPCIKRNGKVQSMEKFILREAFANNYLPDAVLWRQKEQFSDGVGYSWIDTITEYAASHVSDEEFAGAAEQFPINTPPTKEAYYYRQVFEEMFPHQSCASTVKRWVPRTDWGCSADPSGRKQHAHIKKN
ncbi:probable asparagine synthetase [glutamine-hydrolyzing] [Malaya genurostris]|uniref:probable asparagine synthetase [glutamine-hydrolyzing] n=1 Tax=Malaya genurostris TaxID=325434 RepID=UPI0026F3CE7D|nr:probable asparagine synthetase [glutamine-hydrolyzing] [Malaya genurostris]